MTTAAIPLTPGDARFGSGPLTVEHRRELASARERSKKILKVAKVASFNAWCTAIIAVLSVPFAFSSITGLLLTVGFAIIAFNEFQGRNRVLKFDPSGATLLGWNQLGFLAMIIVYCLWTMYTSYNEKLDMPAEVKAAIGDMGDLESLVKQLMIWFYGLVIALSILFQGGNALYYFSRRKLIEKFVAETPEWVRDVQSGTA